MRGMADNRLLRLFQRSLAVLLGGGALLVATPCCGGVRSGSPHPTQKLLSSTISPAGQLQLGGRVHADATTTMPLKDGEVILQLACRGGTPEEFPLFDDGKHGDGAAHDGKWAVAVPLGDPACAGRRYTARVVLHYSDRMYWDDEGTAVTFKVILAPKKKRGWY